MYKISVNNTFGRAIFFTLGSLPFLLYFGLGTLLDWDLKFNKGIIIYCCLSALFLYAFIKFCCLDWDFYVNKGECFLFKKLGRAEKISKGTNFEIKPVLFVSFYLNVFLIKFDTGEKFYFLYNKYRMPLMSFDNVINKIYSLINEKI